MSTGSEHRAPTRVLQRSGALVVVFADAEALVDYAARELAMIASDCVDEHGRFDWVLAGGSTPEDLYRRIAGGDLSLPWARTHVWFGDERCVRPDDPQSNYRMAHAAMLGTAPARAAAVHRMKGEQDPARAALDYEAEIRRECQLPAGGFPAFDLTLLGVGEDGHTASLFPGTPALAVRDRIVVENAVAKLATTRLTMTMPTLCHSRRAWIFAVGARKVAILKDVLGATRDAARWPVQGVRTARPVVWWLDEAAAAGVV